MPAYPHPLLCAPTPDLIPPAMGKKSSATDPETAEKSRQSKLFLIPIKLSRSIQDPLIRCRVPDLSGCCRDVNQLDGKNLFSFSPDHMNNSYKFIPCSLVPPYERNLCYRKSGCRWRLGRLERNNEADSACDNTGIPQELLILLPMAERTLPARPMCCHPMSGSGSGGYKSWTSVEHTSHPEMPAQGAG